MTTRKLKNSISVINFDLNSRAKRRKNEIFPNILRCGIFGPSGGGKSNVLLTILLHIKPFKHLYLCAKTNFQEKYQTLADLVCKHNQEKKSKKTIINYHTVQVDTLPEPEEIPVGSVIIFDDVLTENQDRIANFFLRGRHREISAFYLSQAYTKIPKKSGIRENFNYLILFRQDCVNLRQLYAEYVTDVSFERFKAMCNECWREPYSFLVIDVESETYKYKKRFDFGLNGS